MRELLAAGAETTAEQESGLVSIAAEHNNTEMVKFLYKKYQDGVQSQSGATPFMMAIQEGNAVTMKVLKPDTKIIIKARDNQDRNVLHYALDSRNPTEATQFLISVLNDAEGSLSIKDLLAIEDPPLLAPNRHPLLVSAWPTRRRAQFCMPELGLWPGASVSGC